jgi:amino acid transporter
MGFWALVLYGVGDMLGSGIYALIGKAAGVLGNAVWLGFGVSMLAALLSGLSYAALGSRYPRAGGEAYVTQRAFGRPLLSYLVGLAVIASGLTSMGTQARAFAGYFGGVIASIPFPAVVVAFILTLTLVNFWGMRESAWLNIVCTLVELSGLVIIVAAAVRYWGGVNYLEMPSSAAGHPPGLSAALILQGAVLTFYSFIGFEDMINVSEEVKNPHRNFPLAIMAALAIVTVVYMAVSISAVSVVPHAELAASSQPLVEVARRAAPWFPSSVFTGIALFAIVNTALLNYIMGSRLAYGMARQGLLPAPLGRVHPRRRTPYMAILTLMVLVLVLVTLGDISALASATSALLLLVFMVVNAALIVLQRRLDEPKGAFEAPAFVPVGGVIVCAALLTRAPPRALLIAAALLVGIVLLYFVTGSKKLIEDDIAPSEP